MEKVIKFWNNATAAIAGIWASIPQGGRDFLKGAAFGAIITASVFGALK